jgi:hypothetical protein
MESEGALRSASGFSTSTVASGGFSTSTEEAAQQEENEQEQPAAKIETNFRNTFLQRLSYEKVWIPQVRRALPRGQTVIILDWDDTILPSSYLCQHGYPAGKSISTKPTINSIAAASAKFIALAQSLGQVFIITNAASGWVEHSCRKYMPQLLPSLKGIPIISARTNHEKCHPDNVQMWKNEAFLELAKKQLDLEAVTNLVAIGDSWNEIDALHMMGKEFPHVVTKTVKFVECPSLAELLQQLHNVHRNLSGIVTSGSSVEACFKQQDFDVVEQQPSRRV